MGLFCHMAMHVSANSIEESVCEQKLVTFSMLSSQFGASNSNTLVNVVAVRGQPCERP